MLYKKITIEFVNYVNNKNKLYRINYIIEIIILYIS